MSMHSPHKWSIFSNGSSEPTLDAQRSLQSLMELTTGGAISTNWTFTTMHQGSIHAQAHAKLLCLLVIHDCQWTGFGMGNQAVPKKWKLFPGPLFGQFWDHFLVHLAR